MDAILFQLWTLFAGIPGLFQIWTLFVEMLGFFQIVMLIDCIVNRAISRSAKVIWFICILSVPAIGPLLYFIFGPARLSFLLVDKLPFMARNLAGLLAFLQQRYQQTQRHFNRGQPQPKEDNEPIRTYAQGYQAQYMPLQGGEERGMGDYPQYEQPQALYPEQSQQQM